MPIVILLVWGILNLQQRFEDYRDLQVALELSALEVSGTLDMLIVLTNDLKEQAVVARNSIALFAGEELTTQQLALMEQSVFKEALLQTYFNTVFMEACGRKALMANAQLFVEENGFVVEAHLTERPQTSLGLSTRSGTIRLRMLCEGLGEFMVSNNDNVLTVYLTPNGLSESNCFHTHYCWSLSRAKKVIPIELEQVPQDFPETWYWQGKSYHLCGFCRQERWADVKKN